VVKLNSRSRPGRTTLHACMLQWGQKAVTYIRCFTVHLFLAGTGSQAVSRDMPGSKVFIAGEWQNRWVS